MDGTETPDTKTPLSETAALSVAARWGRVCPLLPLTAPVEMSPRPDPLPQPVLPAGNPNPWQVKAAARAEGGTVTLEMVVLPGPVAAESPPQAATEPVPPPQMATEPIAPPPPPPEDFWEENPEQAAEQLPPPLPPPETVQTVRVPPLRRFFGNVPAWQWLFWVGVMAIAVGGGLTFGRWVVSGFPGFRTDPTATKPPVATAPAPSLLTLANARPITAWQLGRGRLEVYQLEESYATARLAIVTGRTNVAATSQRLLEKRWFGSGRFEPEAERTRRLPIALCGESLDKTREEGLYRLDRRTVSAIRDRLILPRGDRQQVVTIVAYGRNPPRLADELLKSLACR